MKLTALAALIAAVVLSLGGCAEADSRDDIEPVATAVQTTAEAESSSEAESTADSSEADESSSEDSIDSETEAYYEMLANLEREFGSMQEFIDSGFIEEYYKTLDIPYEYIVPKTDDSVINTGGVTAYYSTYSTSYEYKGLSFGAAFDVNFTKYDEQAKKNMRYESLEDLYSYFSGFTYDDMEFTLDKDRQIIIRTSPNNTEGPCIIKYSPGGYPYNLFANVGADLDLLIEASSHIYF